MEEPKESDEQAGEDNTEEPEKIDEEDTEKSVDELLDRLEQKKQKISVLEKQVDEMEDEIEDLEEEVDALDTENKKLKKMVMDKKDSLKKQKERTDTKISAAKKETVRDIVTELTDVRRSLSKALDSSNGEDIVSGLQKTLDLLDKKLEQNGIQLIKPEAGSACEPEKHEVISTKDDSGYPEGSIVRVHTVGYMYEDTVLSPAKVTTAE